MVLAGLCCLGGVGQVVPIELLQGVRIGEVTGADLAGSIQDDGVDGDGVVLHQRIAHREEKKFRDAYGRSADAVVQEHIEFQAPLPGQLYQAGHIEGLEKVTMGLGACIQSAYAVARVVSLGLIVCAMFASCSECYVSLVMFALAALVFSFCCCPAPRYRATRFSIQLFVKAGSAVFALDESAGCRV